MVALNGAATAERSEAVKRSLASRGWAVRGQRNSGSQRLTLAQ